MLVRVGAAPHFAPWMHRILHRFFGRLFWDSRPEHVPQWFESNHQFRLLLEHGNLYVSNNGELRLNGYDPTKRRLGARDSCFVPLSIPASNLG
jgi:hypothetical protein